MLAAAANVRAAPLAGCPAQRRSSAASVRLANVAAAARPAGGFLGVSLSVSTRSGNGRRLGEERGMAVVMAAKGGARGGGSSPKEVVTQAQRAKSNASSRGNSSAAGGGAKKKSRRGG